MNILASPLPSTVDVGGASVALRTGYRTGIQVARTADSDIDDRLKAGTVLRLYFGADVPSDRLMALEVVMGFHRCGQKPAKGRARRILDWDHDAGMVLADFRREYGIDLADSATTMHWWAFMAYFSNLSADSGTKRAFYYRSKRPRELEGADAKQFDRMARAYALPPRTSADAVAHEAAAWGDD